jgi:hypothetical protein
LIAGDQQAKEFVELAYLHIVGAVIDDHGFFLLAMP